MTGLAPPPLSAGHAFRWSPPPFETAELSNGLRAVVCEIGAVPLVHVACLTAAGAADDPPGLEGLAAMVPALMKEGTRRQSASEVNALVAAVGADLVTRVDWHSSSLAIEALDRDAAMATDLVLELLLSPAFTPGSLQRVRPRHIENIRRSRRGPAELAEAWMARTLYGDSGYGRSLLGTEPSVGGIGCDDVARFHRERYTLRGATCVAVGRVSPRRFFEQLAAIPADGGAKPGPSAPFPEPRPLERTRVRLVDHVKATQTEIRIGHVGVSRRDPDFPALRLLGRILEGRLHESLRERRGMTYAVRSGVDFRLAHAPLITEAAVAGECSGQAVREILAQTGRLGAEPIAEAELQAARNHLFGEMLRALQPGPRLAVTLKQLATFGPDHYTRQVNALHAVDAARLTGVARRLLDPTRAAVVAVGRASEIRRQLGSAGAAEE